LATDKFHSIRRLPRLACPYCSSPLSVPAARLPLMSLSRPMLDASILLCVVFSYGASLSSLLLVPSSHGLLCLKSPFPSPPRRLIPRSTLLLFYVDVVFSHPFVSRVPLELLRRGTPSFCGFFLVREILPCVFQMACFSPLQGSILFGSFFFYIKMPLSQSISRRPFPLQTVHVAVGDFFRLTSKFMILFVMAPA